MQQSSWARPRKVCVDERASVESGCLGYGAVAAFSFSPAVLGARFPVAKESSSSIEAAAPFRQGPKHSSQSAGQTDPMFYPRCNVQVGKMDSLGRMTKCGGHWVVSCNARWKLQGRRGWAI